MNDVAPAHNPPYINAMRLLSEKLPEIPLVAAFETGFPSHHSRPQSLLRHSLRVGGAGADTPLRFPRGQPSLHRHADDRAVRAGPENHLLPPGRLQFAVRDPRWSKPWRPAWAFSAQSGLPHANRVGDFDAFALPTLMKLTGKSLTEVLSILASQGGLMGLSGTSGDMRDLAEAAAAGNPRAKLALDVFAASTRHYLGAYLVELGGADAIVFTGGIGENDFRFRAAICANLEELGIVLDPAANEAAKAREAKISAPQSRVQIWVIPTNEELIVARLAANLLSGSC